MVSGAANAFNLAYPLRPGMDTQVAVPEFYDINLSLPGGNYDYVRN